ncbi:MAG: indolepyruvate ferredoxin oxidoreductase family protein [Granulosicoccaceae bacterium]
MGKLHSLDDKYTAVAGDVFLSGTQALIRLPMAQMRRDVRAGLNTASYITGYRGSPLGSYDQQLTLASSHLDPLNITFQPGVNEDLAATAIWGTQQVPITPNATHDGVLGIWYGKGPGVDRSGDVFKHGNAAGSSANGGVLCLAGDDHTAKSSTLPHQSDHAFMAAVMPVLYPSSIHEFIELGLLGIAMSRYSGCWVGMKVISDTVETSAVVSIDGEYKSFVEPTDFELPEGGLNIRWPDPPLVQDERLQELKAYAALAYARANKIDKVVLDSPNARFGIVATGKAFEDVCQALEELGVDQDVINAIGLRLYKVRMPWPLEPEGIREFSEGLEEVLIVEERREIIEHQIKQQLFNWRADVRPRIIGKFDEHDKPFFPHSAAMSISKVARAIAMRVLQFDFDESVKQRIQQRLDYLQARAAQKQAHEAPLERRPWFCAGCPHNTSTKVPKGSKALAGIGCHYMVQWMDRSTDTFTQMGGEGVPWTALANYTSDEHRFVNIGDGTYFHSGLLAIRAAVASGVNITYKVLYNDAVAMTGGQALDGELTPGRISQQLKAEGVSPVYLVSDEPELYPQSELAAGVVVKHREELDSLMRELRTVKGCNAIIYAQTCAAEKRRRRKRGLLEDPPKRLFIHPDVCEGCGDCSEQSNCVAVEPLETEFGRKRKINQSSCNKDYSCANGFCPSFVTINGGQLKKQALPDFDQNQALPEPAMPSLESSAWNIVVTGVGGTGVLTIGSLIGMAAHIDGNASMILDMAGLAQKGGAVSSFIRLAREPDSVKSPHIVAGGADLLFAADSVVASSADVTVLCDPSRTVAVINSNTLPVSDFVKNHNVDFRSGEVERKIKEYVGSESQIQPFGIVAAQLLGDTIATNIVMLGYAWQSGGLPVSLDAMRQAIALNGVAVDKNLKAFEVGRTLNADASRVTDLLQNNDAGNSVDEMSLEQLIEHRSTHLRKYQGSRLVARYMAAIDQFRALCESRHLEPLIIRTIADNYARVLAYKDEYEVARLYSSPEFDKMITQQFDGDIKLSFNLAPPLISKIGPLGRPRKREFGRSVLSVFKMLSRAKSLRGTPFDIFGYTNERRQERAWIKTYEQDMHALLEQIASNDQTDAANTILAIPTLIKGYGPIKLLAMQEATAKRALAWQQFNNPDTLSQVNQAA